MKNIATLFALLLSSSTFAAEPAKAPEAKPATAPANKGDAKPAPKPAPTRVVTGFQTPESVLWDAAGNRYFVSNINGAPLDKDNNGFISIMSADGKVTAQQFVAGGKDGVTLNAPKGMALVGDVLVVADIDHVRMFDAKTGKAKGEVAIAGASFLNDVAADGDKVYVSDTGVGADFKPNGGAAVWMIESLKTKALKKLHGHKDMGGPNGLFVVGGVVHACNFANAEIYTIKDATPAGGKVDVITAPNGGLDGLAFAADGTVYVSSWGGNAIYRGKGKTLSTFVENVTAPADIALNEKDGVVVVPRFMDNTVEFYSTK